MAEYTHTIKTNCKFCGKMFESVGLKKVCPTCEVTLEEDFKRIKEHLENFPGDSAGEISLALNIPLPVITHFMREDRLIMMQQKKGPVLHCEICNKVIHSGHYCFNCSIKTALSGMKQDDARKGAGSASSGDGPTKFHTR